MLLCSNNNTLLWYDSFRGKNLQPMQVAGGYELCLCLRGDQASNSTGKKEICILVRNTASFFVSDIFVSWLLHLYSGQRHM